MARVGHARRKTIFAALITTAVTALLGPTILMGASGHTKTKRVRLRIAASAAPAALAEFVRQTGLQVLFDFDAIRDFSTHAVSGQLDPEEALIQMFEGSGLIYEFVNERTVTVRPRRLVVPAPELPTRRI
jgi:hypothetical protein